MNDGCSVPYLLKKLIPALQDFCDKCDNIACKIHDDSYEVGGDEADRIIADFNLFIAARSACGDYVATIVFNAIRTYGKSHWGTKMKWHGGERAWEQPQEA